MNTKLSGAQMVLVPITRVGKNFFPLVENIRNRFVKFVDFHAATYLPGTTANGLTSTNSMYVTFANEFGNDELISRLPLERLDYQNTLGVRQPIGYKISLENCYVDCEDASQVGKTAAFVVWYDLPEYSRKNTTDVVVTDSISVPLTTAVRYNQLPDENRMVGKRFRRIFVSTPTTTPDLHTGITSTELPNIYITLRKGAYNIAENIPLSLFVQLKMLSKTEFQNINFDFNSSYLTIGGQGTIPTLATDYIGKYVFLNLQYEK